MESISRRTVMLGTLGVAGAAVVGCSSQPPGQSAAPVASSTPTPTGDTTPRWPLTGVPLAAGDDPKHSAVAVKVADNQREHIHQGMLVQQGINQADIVFVENDGYASLPSGEAGTRLVPIYHSKFADAVQAIRSMRPVDAALFSPITGVIGDTGAFRWVMDYMTSFPDYYVSIDYAHGRSKGYYSINSKYVFTYKGNKIYDKAVMCYPAKLSQAAPKRFKAGPQQAYFPWSAEAEASTASGAPATKVKVPWAQKMNWTMSYTWNDKKQTYERSMPWGPHLLQGNERVTTDNILVILAPITYGHINTKGKISAGGAHPEPIYHLIEGSGTFYYAHGGKYVQGTWKKGAIDEPFQFTLSDGSPLKMAPGRTFVELPGDKTKVKFTA